jgi:D-3-phosphoglycerate dehydrogenase
MEVLTFRPTNSFEGYIDGIKMLASAKELYSTCDFVSLHIPANEKTKRSINKSLLSVMPNGAVLINTARKEIINEDDLIEVMKLRTDLKYACDVAPSAHIKMQELFGNRYFGTAKKIGAETSEANINAAYAAANQIVAFFKTGNRQFQVNT